MEQSLYPSPYRVIVIEVRSMIPILARTLERGFLVRKMKTIKIAGTSTICRSGAHMETSLAQDERGV
jgi:hypothetical protein